VRDILLEVVDVINRLVTFVIMFGKNTCCSLTIVLLNNGAPFFILHILFGLVITGLSAFVTFICRATSRRLMFQTKDPHTPR